MTKTELIDAMEATKTATCWYQVPAIAKTLAEAEKRGFVHRPSVTQCHWTEAGVEWVQDAPEPKAPNYTVLAKNLRECRRNVHGIAKFHGTVWVRKSRKVSEFGAPVWEVFTESTPRCTMVAE